MPTPFASRARTGSRRSRSTHTALQPGGRLDAYCKTVSGGDSGSLAADQARPIFIDVLKIAPMGIIPPSLCAATAARPMEATHPHDEQSGFPPYWHGVTFVLRSAVSIWVVRAKTHSCGLAGGVANWRINPSTMSSFENSFRNFNISRIASARSDAVSISGS